ncbi:hypothetical protein [Nocardia crassostreae]|uniref:hypothetical protein n=1 Tax=Nocardia crassostreae TaxID=53428 RepID=UPI0012FBF57E|nr:hypothetical protein [Nocardia crassostreae]
MRTVLERLQDGRGLRFTPVQVWYAVGRKKIPSGLGGYIATHIGGSVALIALTIALLATGTVTGSEAGFAIAGALLLLVVLNICVARSRPWFVAHATIQIPLPYDRFRRDLLNRWVEFHGAPPGLVGEGWPIPDCVAQPRCAVLCPGRSVLTCLAANDAPRTWAMNLCERVDALPPSGPVFVLHDASLAGVAFLRQAREALGPRALDVGLVPRVVMASASALKLHMPRTMVDEAALHREPLSQEEIEWLAAGWWSPIAAVPPAKLLAGLGRVIERAEQTADPEWRRARAVGFLSWPA